MSDTPSLPPLPEPEMTTPITFGCDGRWWSEHQVRDYGVACRAASVAPSLEGAAVQEWQMLTKEELAGVEIITLFEQQLAATVQKALIAKNACRPVPPQGMGGEHNTPGADWGKQ